MSNAVSDEPITCPSCEYRYPRSEAICVMCGTPAPAVELDRPLSSIPNKFSGDDHEAGLSSSDSQQRTPLPGLRRLIPVVVVLIALMLVTLFFYKVRKGSLPKESGPAAELMATSGQPKLENAGNRHIVHKPVRGVQHVVAAKLGTAQTTDPAKENDPVELWKAVGDRERGSRTSQPLLGGRGCPPEL